MLGGEGIETATVEGAGYDVGQGLAFEGVTAVDVEVADAIARGANSDDLAAAVVEVRDTATTPDLILKNAPMGSPARKSISRFFQRRRPPRPSIA